MFVPMPFQSSMLTASGFKVGIAENRFSGTNWKRASNARSLGRTCLRVLHASALAASPWRGTHAGTAKRADSPPMMMRAGSFGAGGGCCAAHETKAATETAAAPAEALRDG